MPTPDLAQKSRRLASLDAFRGITIAMMILVNNPGNWGAVYPPLLHAKWHGWTFTDLIFPFFLFIVGVAIVLAFHKRLKSGQSKKDLYLKILKRTLILFGLGLFLNAYAGIPNTIAGILITAALALGVTVAILSPQHPERKAQYIQILKRGLQILLLLFIVISFTRFDFATVRIPGVLQRIAVCYAVAAIIVLNTNIRMQAYIAFGILIIYWILMKTVPVPGYGAGVLEPQGNLAWYVDSILLRGHTWTHAPAPGFDPEGIMSTFPAISTVLMGVLTGHWLKTKHTDPVKVNGMFVAGCLALLAGTIIGIWFPINKNLWSSSYTVYMAGMALLFLAICYWLIDIHNYKSWAKPFIVFGSNAIIIYTISSFTAKVLAILWKVPHPASQLISMKTFLYQNIFATWLNPVNASLAYAVCYLLIWFILAYVLYYKKIFIKV